MPAAPQESAPLPGIALQLTQDGHHKQLAGHAYIPDLIRQADPQLGLVPEVSPLFVSHTTEALAQTEALAAQRNPTYQKVGFESWYQIRFTRSTDTPVPGLEGSGDLAIQPRLLQLVRKLQENASVISVQFLHAGPPPVDPDQNPLSGSQGYIDAAPQGIDARAAWAKTGGDGTNVHIVDIEQGWNLNHEDLVAADIRLASGMNHSYFPHGTAVLGEMLMVDNTIGGIGISPKAKGTVVSQWVAGVFNTPNAISAAIKLCTAGDFILIEAQEYDPVSGSYYWPVEIADANFQLIQLATSLGITVIEPACNGSYNLDQYVSSTGKYIFKRGDPGYRESGATMVGAGSSGLPHVRLAFSNFGTRVDVFGWGEKVVSTYTNDAGTENRLYTKDFSGTSSASPIIAGAAMNIQGVVKAQLKTTWDPLKIRSTLQIGGTPTAKPATDLIGVLPNLKAILGGNISEIEGKLGQESLGERRRY